MLRCTRAWRSVLLVSIALCSLVSPLSAQRSGEPEKSHKERKAQAKEAYAEGRERFDAGDYGGALEAFQRANDLDRQSAYVFNIAQSHRLRGDCESAEQSYRSYLRAAPLAPNRSDVETWLAEMTACREERERQHQGDAAKEPAPAPDPELGRQPEPQPQPSGAGSAPPEIRDRDGSSGRNAVGLIVAGSGVALLGGAVYFGLRSRSASAEIDALLSRGGVFDQRQQDIQARGQRDETLSIALAGVGGSLVVGGLIYYFLSSSEQPAEDPGSLQVRLGASGGGARAEATWSF